MEKTLYQQVEGAAKRYPNELALSNGDITLNYEEALNRVNILAANLTKKGFKPQDVVALYADKSVESILAFLALSRLGISCLTLDLAFPETMIDWVLTDANVKGIIALKPLPLKSTRPVLSWADLSQVCQLPKTPAYDKNHTAWLVYSSGTTGKPKGVKISSYAMVGSMIARAEFSPYPIGEKVACHIYFFWEAFRPLCFGATTVTLSDAILFDLTRYQTFLNEHKIVETLWTPSFAEMLLSNLDEATRSQFSTLQRVWLNGEVVNESLAKTLTSKLPHIEFYNLYSISETFDVSARAITKTAMEKEFTSIGQSFSGVTCTILDESLNPCPKGQLGELYLTSPYLAEGYLNRPEDDAKSFLDIEGTRYFKTKDTAYQNKEGECFILGRNDHVVKLRGYNVSLLSIESVLKKVLPVKQCVVRLEGDSVLAQTLVAEMEPQDNEHFIDLYQLDVSSGLSEPLQSYLTDFLPSYAVPARFKINAAFKMNPYSAKLERKKQDVETNVSALQNIWSSILSLSHSSLTEDSDFFKLGANSLQTIQLLHAIKKAFNLTLSIEQLESHATLGALENLIKHNTAEKNQISYDFMRDIRFSETMKTTDIITCARLDESKDLFVTGTTGFLGAHWLSHALQDKEKLTRYYCLVRASSPKTGLQRLKDAFNHYELDETLLDHRITIICGDLTKSDLGIDKPLWNNLCQTIDCIFHAAAYVNLLYPYSKLKATIVEGTRQILALAITKKIKPFIMISSDAVLPDHDDTVATAFTSPDEIAKLTYGYAQAKAVQEQLLKSLHQHYHLPYAIFRLGNLAPSLSSGISNQDDLNQYLLSLIKRTQVCPASLYIEFTPVDRIVSTINQALSISFPERIITLSQYNTFSAEQLIESCPDWKIEVCSDEEWSGYLAEYTPILDALSPIKALFKAKPYRVNTALFPLCTLSEADRRQTLNALAPFKQAETAL